MAGFIIALYIIAAIVVGFMVYKIVKWKGELKKTQSPKQEKSKEELVDKDVVAAQTNKIKVLIFRPLSDGLVAQIGSPIICEEKPDNNNNLTVINPDKNFKEDFSFSQDRIFEVMNFNLKLQNKTKKEKRAVLDEQIKAQEEFIMEIDKDVALNAKYNYEDETLKLSQLKVLRDSLKMETAGNYMRLGQGGIRQYELVSIDGVLYPYFFGGRWYRAYPDLLVKKKIFNHENSVFRNETAALLNKAMNWLQVITIALGVIMIVAGGFMLTHAYGKNTEISANANAGAISCANTLAEVNEVYGDAVKEYIVFRQSGKQTNINTQTPDNSISINDIIIDPTKITK